MREVGPITTRRLARLGPRLVPVALAMALTAAGATAATLSTTASVTIVSPPLIVSGVAQLRFGTLTSGGTAGTVVVTTDNRRLATGGAVLLGPGNFGPAEFAIAGQPNANYTITLPRSVVIERANTANPEPGVTALEAVDLKSFSTTVGAETGRGRTGPQGVDTVLVGATLLVTATTKPGNYRGEIAIGVAYE